jgi:hypothetical protein
MGKLCARRIEPNIAEGILGQLSETEIVVRSLQVVRCSMLLLALVSLDIGLKVPVFKGC